MSILDAHTEHLQTSHPLSVTKGGDHLEPSWYLRAAYYTHRGSELVRLRAHTAQETAKPVWLEGGLPVSLTGLSGMEVYVFFLYFLLLQALFGEAFTHNQ